MISNYLREKKKRKERRAKARAREAKAHMVSLGPQWLTIEALCEVTGLCIKHVTKAVDLGYLAVYPKGLHRERICIWIRDGYPPNR